MKFCELIDKILKENKVPMSGSEIWKDAVAKGYDKELNGSGKYPHNTITSILYTDEKKLNKKKYIRHSKNPYKFTLNANQQKQN